MATADESVFRLDGVAAVARRFGLDAVRVVVLDVVLVALALRLFRLGGRVAHWDEARVAFWTLDYMQTGHFEYRPIIHGPFYHHVNRVLFEVFGATDFTMRLSVAVIGGLFPLSALLLRDRLRDVEVVGLAFFLAFNPALLYYTRFMRGDPLVATFMFAGFALFVRAIDTAKRGYFFAGVACVALAFTAKENALIYLVTWAGGVGLLLDHRLFSAADRGEDWGTVLLDYLGTAWAKFKYWFPELVVGLFEFLLVIVFFYAPRAGSEGGVGLWKALANPALLPAVLQEATVGSWQKFWGLWVSGGHQDHAYLPFLGDFLQTMAHGAGAVALLAVLGFVADRYSEEGPRDVVAFGFYTGFVSVLGYPIVTDIMAPWAILHAVLPLTIPAAVGVGLLFRWGRSAVADRDGLPAAVSALALALVVLQVGGAGLSAVYVHHSSQDNELVQYAQPADDIHPVTERMAAAAPRHEGTDVVLYGDFFVADEQGQLEPGCAKWFNALPLPWYFEASDASVACADSEEALMDQVRNERPVFVVMPASDGTEFRGDLRAYEPVTYRLRAWGTETTFFVKSKWAAGLETDH